MSNNVNKYYLNTILKTLYIYFIVQVHLKKLNMVKKLHLSYNLFQKGTFSYILDSLHVK